MITLFLILIGIIILLCIWLNNVSARIGIPTLLAFIVLGMIFSNNGLVPLHFEDHVFAKETCTVALIFIMFYGGFGTRWDSAKPVVREATLLASLGVILTAGLTGLFCHFALRWGWGDSSLFSILLCSTEVAGFQRLLFYFAFLTLFGMTSGSTIESSIKPAYSPSSYQGVWKISFFTPSFSTV